MVAPVRVRLPAPAVAVMVPPPQLPVRPFGMEISKPEGKASVKPTPVSGMRLPFVMVKLSEVEPSSGIAGRPKDFAIVGAEATPVPVRARVCGLLPAVSVTVSVAVREPIAVGVKVTLMLHVPRLATEDPQVAVLE
jgi:hypothetical protein